MQKIICILISFFSVNFTFAQIDSKLAIQTWTFHTSTLMESIDKAEQLSINYLEVYPGQKVGGDIKGVFSYTLSQEDRSTIKKMLQEKGIRVIALGVVDKYYYTKENLEQFFIFCKEMGIPFLTAEPEPQDLDLFNQLAKKHKIKVGLHSHPKPGSHYWHPDSTVAAMRNRKYIGAWPDIGHWARNGVDIVEGLKKVKKKLWGMHFKDIQEFDNVAAEDTLFGKGVCNLPAVMEELKKQRYKGVVTLEYEVRPEDNMEDMRANILYFKKNNQ